MLQRIRGWWCEWWHDHAGDRRRGADSRRMADELGVVISPPPVTRLMESCCVKAWAQGYEDDAAA